MCSNSAQRIVRGSAAWRAAEAKMKKDFDLYPWDIILLLYVPLPYTSTIYGISNDIEISPAKKIGLSQRPILRI